MKRGRTSILSLGMIGCWALLGSTSPVQARDIRKLDILKDQYPRVFFFRATEGAYNQRRYPTFERWERQFNRLQGIMGKCLDEECLGRQQRNPEFFSRFKRQHPNQVVLLHFNGNARDPRYHTEKYFSGHWIYREATEIVQDVPAETGETVIRVENARLFHVNSGRYRTSNDDIAFFGITKAGKHDWYHCEQVQLVAVDPKAGTITVKRGCYGTKPLAFRARQARAAAHVVEGPWGARNHLMWYYNFATHCPKDRAGKTCADHLVDDLALWFGPQGPLAAFDGLEFDVMFNETHGDTDGDGVEDGGIIAGINQYGIGMVEFARQLRQRMTDNFIMQGDGALGAGGMRSQRCWGILNGIESEGWPNLRDWDMQDWSGGLNRHFFWRENARKPVFNYVNHKWVEPVPGKPGIHTHPKVPYARHRLALAACQFFDAMTCYSFAPPQDPDGKFGIWDELRCGADNRLGWLGKPEAPAVRLATQTPSLLSLQDPAALANRIAGPVKAVGTPAGVKICARDPDTTSVRFSVGSVPTRGSDLFLAVEMKAEPMTGYPREMARFARVGVSGGMIDLMAEKPLAVGMKLRGVKEEEPLDRDKGASFQDRPRTIAGQKLSTFFVHPPYKDGKGYTFWTQEATVPENSELRFAIGMGEKSPERSDGVWFQVYVAPVTGSTVGDYTRIFEDTTKKHQWLPQVVALKSFAGRRLRFKFVADCGPKDNATTDHAHWGAVRIVATGASDDEITQAVQFMTWTNDRPFRSGFYYRHIRSPEVAVSFNIEGTEPVVLRSLAAYGHPDAICRVFEGGIVLANPSLQPYTFDLSKLSPGRSYRRLRATSTQDARTNDGTPVGSTVTIGERDALFLIRVR